MNRITYHKGILGGKPIIKGTRIAVSLVLNLLANGMTPEEIINEYPQLKTGDIRAAIDYAAKTLEGEEIVLAIKKG